MALTLAFRYHRLSKLVDSQYDIFHVDDIYAVQIKKENRLNTVALYKVT